MRSGWNGVSEEQEGRGDAWAVCESCGGQSSLPRSFQHACGEQRNRRGGLADAGWGLERAARLPAESARTCHSVAPVRTPMITGCPPPTSQRRPVELVTSPRELVRVARSAMKEETQKAWATRTGMGARGTTRAATHAFSKWSDPRHQRGCRGSLGFRRLSRGRWLAATAGEGQGGSGDGEQAPGGGLGDGGRGRGSLDCLGEEFEASKRLQGGIHRGGHLVEQP